MREREVATDRALKGKSIQCMDTSMAEMMIQKRYMRVSITIK